MHACVSGVRRIDENFQPAAVVFLSFFLSKARRIHFIRFLLENHTRFFLIKKLFSLLAIHIFRFGFLFPSYVVTAAVVFFSCNEYFLVWVVINFKQFHSMYFSCFSVWIKASEWKGHDYVFIWIAKQKFSKINNNSAIDPYTFS